VQQLIINGGKELTGEIEVSGAKNSVVALIPAAILCDEEVTISNVPNISDVEALQEILEYLNVKVEKKEDTLKINPKELKNVTIPESISKKLRASYYFMGALLSKYKRAEIYFPGGCPIGKRPIDIHIKGFEKLGAKVTIDDNKYTIEAQNLIGTTINLDFPSVGATINLILAATKAQGTTIIENAAKEPEIVNIATFLNNMGAKITGAGTSIIKIEGVERLTSCFHEVIPDRIEAGTYMILAAATGKNIKIKNIIPAHLESLISKLIEMNIPIEIGSDYAIISKSNNLKPVNVKTQIYPGFPTDLQQPLTALMTQCNGKSIVEETIWENRFLNLAEFNKMGAKTSFEDRFGYIEGKTKLIGTEITACDLRGGASLVIAGLIADGTTTINGIEHILRGYEGICEKLTNIGANIEIKEI